MRIDCLYNCAGILSFGEWYISSLISIQRPIIFPNVGTYAIPLLAGVMPPPPGEPFLVDLADLAAGVSNVSFRFVTVYGVFGAEVSNLISCSITETLSSDT